MISVLVIEDDTQISRLIESTLTAEGYHCECALDGQIGADCIEEKVYDLILLDLMLPQISGYELLEYIVTVGTPVIIISAMGQVKDRIRGLRMGADDYLSKPFQIGELLARVETVLRRTKRIQDKITIDDVTLDPVSRQVFKDGHQINLTVKEFDLLMELVGNKNVLGPCQTVRSSLGRKNTVVRPERWILISSVCVKNWIGMTRIVTVFRIGYRLEVHQ